MKILESDIDVYAEYLHRSVPFFVRNKNVFAMKILYNWAYRHVEFAGIPVCASQEAYNEFLQTTGKDIRNYNWYSTIKDKNGETFVIHKKYRWEHFNPASQFRDQLEDLFNKNKWTVDSVKELLLNQRIVWITKAEDKELLRLGYKSVRPNPEQAYKEAGIKIICEPSVMGYGNNNSNINKGEFTVSNLSLVTNRNQKHSWSYEDNCAAVKAYFNNLSKYEMERIAKSLDIKPESFFWAVRQCRQLDTGRGNQSISSGLQKAFQTIKSGLTPDVNSKHMSKISDDDRERIRKIFEE